jgi:hypothetical protein
MHQTAWPSLAPPGAGHRTQQAQLSCCLSRAGDAALPHAAVPVPHVHLGNTNPLLHTRLTKPVTGQSLPMQHNRRKQSLHSTPQE